MKVCLKVSTMLFTNFLVSFYLTFISLWFTNEEIDQIYEVDSLEFLMYCESDKENTSNK